MSSEWLVPIPVARKECVSGMAPSLTNILEIYDFFRDQVLITAEKINQKLVERGGDITEQHKRELDNQLGFLKLYVKKKAELMQKCHKSVTEIYLQSTEEPFRLFQDI